MYGSQIIMTQPLVMHVFYNLTSETYKHSVTIFPLCVNMRREDTTRARKCHERDGVEYHFITKAAFEADIQNSKWVSDIS